jgi:hypothetical protein
MPHPVSTTIAIGAATASPGVIARMMTAATIAVPTSTSSTLGLTAALRRSTSRMNFKGEQDQPCQPRDLQRPVGQHHVLGRLARSAVDESVVAE